MNRVIEEMEHFLDVEFTRLTKNTRPNKSPEKYFIAEVVLIRAKLASFKAKYGYEN